VKKLGIYACAKRLVNMILDKTLSCVTSFAYLVDELSNTDDVTLSVEDWQAEHRLGDEAVAVLQVLAQPGGHVAQV